MKVWLNGTSKGVQSLCCDNGNALSVKPLHPLPLAYALEVNDLDEQFTKYANVYNNMLSLASIGIDNGEKRGFDKFFGPHNVRMTGRTYHRFLPTNIDSGLKYFLVSAQDELIAQGWYNSASSK
jgi:hypothetical protein